jgi:hypothetical protein
VRCNGPDDGIRWVKHPALAECGKEESVDDATVLSRINELAAEEHSLFEKEAAGDVTPAERDRLAQLAVTLDQCWDLLRQRRARRAAGLDPNEAATRDETTVERYTG